MASILRKAHGLACLMKMYTDYMIKTDKLWELDTLSYLKNDKYGI